MGDTALRREDLLAYLSRDWGDAEARKRAYWVERVRVEGAIAGARASDALREHVAAFVTGREEDRRAEDLAHHVALKRRIDAASARLPR